MIKITYFVHGTTTDNEKHIVTGWAQGKLSKLGKVSWNCSAGIIESLGQERVVRKQSW